MSETFYFEVPNQANIREKSGRMLLDYKSKITEFLEKYYTNPGNLLSEKDRTAISDFFQEIINAIKVKCQINTIEEMNQAKALCWFQGINYVIRSSPKDKVYLMNEMERVWAKVEVDSNKSLQSSPDQVSLMKTEQIKILQDRRSDLQQVFRSLRNFPNHEGVRAKAILSLQEIIKAALNTIGKFALNQDNHAYAVIVLNGLIESLKKGAMPVTGIDVIEVIVNNDIKITKAVDNAIVDPSAANLNHVFETLIDTKKDIHDVVNNDQDPTNLN